MIRSFLRSEFDKGHDGYYLLAMAPFGMLVSLVFPAQLIPFALAVFPFPVFFYYVRRGRYARTFWMMALWAALQWTMVFSMTAMNADFMVHKLYGAAGGVLRAPALESNVEDILRLGVTSLAGFFFILALAGLSGGAFAIVAGAVGVNGSAFSAAKIVHGGGGWTAALMSVTPWTIANFVGLALGVVAVSALFYMKLERRPIEWDSPVRYFILGLAFTAFGVYLEAVLTPVWAQAMASAAQNIP